MVVSFVLGWLSSLPAHGLRGDVSPFLAMARYGARVEELAKLKEEFILWLLDPAREGSQANWCRVNGVDESYVRKWKRDGDFQRRLEERQREFNLDAERIQQVLNAVQTEAAGGNMQAAKLYLDYIKAVRPRTFAPTHDHTDPSELSDEDLAQALRDLADEL